MENRLIDMGRGEERVECREKVTWKHITICKIDSQREFAVCLRKLKLGLCINLAGWDGEGDREVQKGGDVCIPMADSCCNLTVSSSYNLSIQYILLNKVFLHTTLDSKPQAAQIPRRL